ncbi:hypothetical protein [Mesorhizobium sp. M7A.F.Ca.MR.362.00.0.0]|uniref:hypothetical protein n=1 Tax=Mesorhizobium sp. M7A.F.Ca.MR.362.00.0.0 TaxID=2496779 RepID=UPI000FD2A36E|nr:hypothetical protein [Mesorhizobium sp. M7A.F.Ca.MR.362.00.0.0]RUU78216.1 hypothetical protein EOC06_20590 [Mesorhizobium sp. M7A.F.Ca.MR.362.00.0.0]
MTVHTYSRWTFKASRLAHMETVEIDDVSVFRQIGLLSNWNRVSARGFETSGILYLYHPEHPK